MEIKRSSHKMFPPLQWSNLLIKFPRKVATYELVKNAASKYPWTETNPVWSWSSSALCCVSIAYSHISESRLRLLWSYQLWQCDDQKSLLKKPPSMILGRTYKARLLMTICSLLSSHICTSPVHLHCLKDVSTVVLQTSNLSWRIMQLQIGLTLPFGYHHNTLTFPCIILSICVFLAL